MSWYTATFVDSAKNSWLAKSIPSDKIHAVFRLLDHKDAVIELHDTSRNDLYDYFQAALAYRNNSTEFRHSDASLSSFQSSARSSIFSTLPERDSVASNITTFSNFSVNSKQSEPEPRKGRASRLNLRYIQPDGPSALRAPVEHTPTRDASLQEGRYFCCPNCSKFKQKRKGYFVKHLNACCKKSQKGYKCAACGAVEKDENIIQTHHQKCAPFCTIEQVELPQKKAYGCPYCGSYQRNLDDYIRCVCNDQEADQNLLPTPSLRVRGLLEQNDIKVTVAYHCRKRGLPPEAWRSFVWSDDCCARFAETLEYGCNEKDDIYRLGVEDPNEFINALLESAVFEGTGRPVPPAKDLTAIDSKDIVPWQLDLDSLERFQVEQVPAQALSSTRQYFIEEKSPGFSVSENDVQRQTAMALRNLDNESMQYWTPYTSSQSKRPLSFDASSLPADRSRLERQPPWMTAEFPRNATNLIDQPLMAFRNAIFETAPQPSGSQVLSHPIQNNIGDDLISQAYFGNELFDNNERL